MKKKKDNYQPIHNYLTFEDLIEKSGYPTNGRCRGLSVEKVDKDRKGQTILTVAPSPFYSKCWLEKALQKGLEFTKRGGKHEN